MTKKAYQCIVIIVAIFLGILGGVLIITSEPAQIAFNEPITEEDYELLRENALIIAKTLDEKKLSEDSLISQYYLGEHEMYVTVESEKVIHTVKIPVISQMAKAENGTITLKGMPDLSQAQFINRDKINSKSSYILAAIGFGGLIAIIVYLFLFEVWFGTRRKK